MYPENPEGTQVTVGSMNMGYISDTARNRAHNLFRPKREPIPLGHSDGHLCTIISTVARILSKYIVPDASAAISVADDSLISSLLLLLLLLLPPAASPLPRQPCSCAMLNFKIIRRIVAVPG